MVCLAFAANKVIAPNHPNPEKLTSYECGEEPTGNAWLPFNSRFYVIALIFLLFDVEMVFIFPWATVFADKKLVAADSRWTAITLTEMFIFMGILILGLAYVWVKGDLEWIKPKNIVLKTDVNIPASAYEKLNLQQQGFKVRPFTPEIIKQENSTAAGATATATEIKRPMFKPTFKKPEA